MQCSNLIEIAEELEGEAIQLRENAKTASSIKVREEYIKLSDTAYAAAMALKEYARCFSQ